MTEKKPDQTNIISFNQHGGITAQNVFVGSTGRRLDDGLKQQILSGIPKTKKVVVSGALGDGESTTFAHEIMTFMQSQGYTVEGVNQSVWMPPIMGIGVNNSTDPWQLNVGHNPSR